MAPTFGAQAHNIGFEFSLRACPEIFDSEKFTMRTLASILAVALVAAMITPRALASKVTDDEKKQVVWVMTYSGGGS